jgi:ABC-type transporter Mla subunit MlaD
MRRLAAIAAALALASTFAAVALAYQAQGGSTVRFDVIFDNARGLVGGQLVKIAGARAGTIENVVVTPGFKARIEATVDGRFMPLHQNATCAIRPEGLIAENYLDCDPGTAGSPPLQAADGHPPTVPVTHTTEPVGLLDLFNIFNLPTRERLMLIIDELGTGTSGRGQDLNEILLRANPTLQAARSAIGILARQRTELQTVVDATNTIAAQGASHTADLQSFLDRASALTTLTAAHEGSLAQAVNRLPGLLAQTQPALQQLDIVAAQGTPLVEQIHAAVPSLNQVASDLGPFVAAAKPGLARLGTALSHAIPAIRDSTPVVRTLRSYADRSLSGTKVTGALFKNLQQHGFVENFLSIAYYIGASLSRFDATSHLLPVLLVAADNGVCGNYAYKPVPACSAHYGSQPPYKPDRRAAQEAATDPLFGASGQTLRGLANYLLK